MPKRIFLVTLLSLFQFCILYSQTPSYYHYTSSDGLASSTVLSIIQDRSGFIWFATLNGLSTFDGKHFTTFRSGDGLNSNSITSIVEGKNGELFIGTYENGINVLKNGRIENYCPEIEGKAFATSYLLQVPEGKDGQKLYTYRVWGLINVIYEKTGAHQSEYSFNTNPERVVKLEKLWNEEVIAVTLNGLFHFRNDSLTKMIIGGLPDHNIYCLAPGNDGSYCVGSKGMIFRIKNNIIINRYKINLHATDNDVTAILIDKNNNLWFSVMNRGFYLIPNGSDEITDVGSKMDLQNTLVNNYLEDTEGNIWVSTFGKGVYCLNNLYLKSYNEKDGLSNNNVYSIAQDRSGKLLIGTFNGLNILENGKFDQVKSNSGNTLTDYIYNIEKINNGFYICGTFGLYEMINISYNGIKLYMFSCPSFCKTNNGLYLFGTNGNQINVHRYLHNNKDQPYPLRIFGDRTKINRINKIFEDSKMNLWVGTGLGLCKVNGLTDPSGKSGWEKTFFPTDSVLNAKINSIFEDADKNVWFAGEKGIARYDLKNDLVTSYSHIKGHDLSSSTCMVTDARNRFWIGNMKGLYLFDGNSVKQLNSQTGLPSDEVLSLFFDNKKNFLYIGTSNGISFLDIKLFDKYDPPPLDLKIISIKAGDSVYTNYDNLVFKPKQNRVYIDFKALSFSSPGSVKYRYNLNGESVETEHDFLDLVSLKSGHYVLRIMAKSQNTDWGRPYHLSFEVKPLFSETIWFKFGGALILVILSGFFVMWRLKLNNKKVRQEHELNERINELKHLALSAMMNPHFIFNALNSVQYLINCQRNEEANDYVAIMSKLIRKNLDTAGNGFILLSEEINRLNLYLDLEKLRLQDGFSYEITAGTDVDTGSIMIPNMIIQPFVENTLWHGIIDSGKKGLLTVSFTFEDIDIDSLICRALIIKVTDNGIGINEARKNKKEDHISKGIQIIEERLRLLSTREQIPQPILFEDLSNRNDHSQGTEVIISLPPQLYKMISS